MPGCSAVARRRPTRPPLIEKIERWIAHAIRTNHRGGSGAGFGVVAMGSTIRFGTCRVNEHAR
jgi:hypothetical protein